MNGNYSKILNYVKLVKKSQWIEELKKFQCSFFDTFARWRLVEDHHTSLELIGKVQVLQDEVNCMNDSKYFQDVESIRSGNSHVFSQRVSLPPHRILDKILSRFIGMPSPKEGPESIWDTHGKSGNVSVNPNASSSALYPQKNPLSPRSTVEKSDRRTQDQDRDVSRASNDCNVRSSFRQLPCKSNVCLLEEDKLQNWGMLLVHNFLRMLCIGSRKCRFLIQCVIWCLCNQQEEFKC